MAFVVNILPPGPIKRSYNAIIAQRSKECLARMGLKLKEKMVKRSLQVRDGGTLADSWQIDPAQPVRIGNTLTITVVATGAGGIVALVWDKGTREGRHPFPPTGEGSPLRRWVRRQLGVEDDAEAGVVARKVARAISIRGLPNPDNSPRRKVGIFTRTARRTIRDLRKIGDACQVQIASDIAGNR